MHIPIEAYKEQLEEEVTAIAARSRTDEFETATTHPELVRPGMPVPIQVTDVHMVTGDPNPRLRKHNFSFSPYPKGVIDGLVELYSDEVIEKRVAFNNDQVREYTGLLNNVCDEIDQNESGLAIPPFRILTVTSIYDNGGEPFSINFTSWPFIQALASKVPDALDPEEIPDEALRELYALEAETRMDILPFEEWKEDRISEAVRVAKELGNMKISSAMGFLKFIMPPEKATHPVINAELFEEK